MALKALKTPLWPRQHFLGERLVRQNATTSDHMTRLCKPSMLGNEIRLHNAVTINKHQVIALRRCNR